MHKFTKAAVAAALAIAAGAVGYGVADASSPPRTNGAAAAHPFSTTGPSVTENSFVPLTPCRIASTLLADGPYANGESRSYVVRGKSGFPSQGGKSGGCKVPLYASAVDLTVTAFGATGSGRFVAYPADASTPLASTTRYNEGIQSSGSTAVKLATSGSFDLKVKNNFATAGLVIDVSGYFAPPLNAYVGTDGTLAQTSGRAIASERESVGQYNVYFDRDVSKCSYTVTPFDQNWSVAVGPGPVDRGVHVYIHDPVDPFASHDTSFYMQVTC